MKAQLHIQDHNCPQTPVIRKFASQQMHLLAKKDPRIRTIRVKCCKLPGRSIEDVYKVQAVAKGQGPTISGTARSVTVRSALKSLRQKMSRRMVQRKHLPS
jgi:ribosome-associated translation inhibitor RaiA